MFKSYFEARYPARDGRESIPTDERVARYAAHCIADSYWGDDLCWHARRQGIIPPVPNKSARINRRTPAGMGEWIEVRGSAEFFDRVAEFIAALDAAGWR